MARRLEHIFSFCLITLCGNVITVRQQGVELIKQRKIDNISIFRVTMKTGSGQAFVGAIHESPLRVKAAGHTKREGD